MAVLLINLSTSSAPPGSQEQTLALTRDFMRHPLLPERETLRLVCTAGSDLAVAANSASIPLVELEEDSGGLALHFALRRLIKDLEVTQAYTFDPSSFTHMSLLRRLFGFSLLHSVSDSVWRRNFIRDRLARQADFLIVPSEDRIDDLTRAGISQDRIRSVFPVYAPREKSLSPARVSPRASGGHFIFVAACEMLPDKGLHTLIQAMSYLQNMGIDLPPWEVRVVGQGPLFAELLASAEAMGVAGRIALLGDQPRAAIMRSAHAVIAASSAGRGDAPLIFDAWAMRLPVACTALPVHQSLGQDKEAFLLSPPDKSVALAGSMLRMLTEPEIRARLIQGGASALAAADPLVMARAYAALGGEADQRRAREKAEAAAKRDKKRKP